MDYSVGLIEIILVALVLAFLFRKRLRAWIGNKRRPADEATDQAVSVVPALIEPLSLTSRLYELEKVIAPFGNSAAHPSALYANAEFVEAIRLLAAPEVPLVVVLQYVEGNMWALSSAALAALRKRPERGEAAERVLQHCEYYPPWPMYFALELLAETEPRVAVGAPLVRAKDWWIDNRWLPNIFRDYLARCAAQGDEATFGASLALPGISPHETIRKFLQRVTHPSAATLIKQLDDIRLPPAVSVPSVATLNVAGRFWSKQRGTDVLVEPNSWHKAFAIAEATLQNPPRSLLVSGEPLVGKSSFLQLLAQRIAREGWSVFEASGADLQADQIYIGQLEGRIRHVIDELSAGHRLIWYIPDVVQLAMSGRHQGQSATMLDQIIPAIAAGRLLIWCEATPKGAARLMQLKPSMRGLLETVTIEPLAPGETLTLARDVMKAMAARANIHFAPECADVALDTASQYLGVSGLPGSALLMLKLTAVRAKQTSEDIAPRQVLETLSQLSGLPVSILDTKGQLDLKSIRNFFTARVIGQDEAVEAMVERIAMLKAGLNDPNKPIGVFLFAGPTGTGKTELAKALTEFLFGSVERMIRLDMSEFQTHDSIGKILGQPAAPVDTDFVDQPRPQAAVLGAVAR